jgi:hypothetical protein
MLNRNGWILILAAGACACAQAQWVNHPTPGTPRTRDGKPNLSAPAPRVKGKPDLSGVWEVEGSPRKVLAPFLLPGGENGLGEDDPSIYFVNFLADYGPNPAAAPFQPAGLARYQQRSQSGQRPPSLCVPPSLPTADLLPVPFKIVQTPALIMMLYEGDTTFRQIFTDGRALPDDPQPAWLGYSIGKWDGDSMVVEAVGFNDKSPLDAFGHPHSEGMKVTERFHRRDFGHMEVQLTIDDPKTFTKAIAIKVNLRLLPDTDLIESFCIENEKDVAHMRGQ